MSGKGGPRTLPVLDDASVGGFDPHPFRAEDSTPSAAAVWSPLPLMYLIFGSDAGRIARDAGLKWDRDIQKTPWHASLPVTY
jgi:hypothetical protein